jgi:DNA-binding MarR family transcriptional regulator
MDSRSAPARLRELPSWLISQTALTAAQLVSRRLSTAGAHRWHYSMLTALVEFGPASQADLGRRIGLDRSDVTSAVSELATGGLVERGTDSRDRRRNTVRITDLGRARLRELDRLTTEAQEQLLAPLSARERRDLVRLLTRVLDFHTAPG